MGALFFACKNQGRARKMERPTVYYSPACAHSLELISLLRTTQGGVAAYRMVDVSRRGAKLPSYVDCVPALVVDGMMYTDEPLFELFTSPPGGQAQQAQQEAGPSHAESEPIAADSLFGGAFSGTFAPLDGVQDANVLRPEQALDAPEERLLLEDCNPMPTS
jgi:hypothetical protein